MLLNLKIHISELEPKSRKLAENIRVVFSYYKKISGTYETLPHNNAGSKRKPSAVEHLFLGNEEVTWIGHQDRIKIIFIIPSIYWMEM